MSDSKFKTMRHIETVRNYLNLCIRELMVRQEEHDQTKLQSPEVEIFEEYTPKLRECTYGSDEYKSYMKEMGVALEHHYDNNRHHPEHFQKEDSYILNLNSSLGHMNLIDIIEMLCDWKAATMRHNDGDIMRSIEINQKRFGYTDELKNILINTAQAFNDTEVFHKSEES